MKNSLGKNHGRLFPTPACFCMRGKTAPDGQSFEPPSAGRAAAVGAVGAGERDALPGLGVAHDGAPAADGVR